MDSRITDSINLEYNENIEQLEELCAQKWNTYSVTPIFNLKFDELSIKQFCRNFKIMFLNEIKIYNDIIITFESKNMIHSNDPQGFRLNIINQNKLLYEGYYFSYDENITKNETKGLAYPILLCRGSNVEVTHEIISKLFGCVISKISFKVKDIIYLLVLHLNIDRKINSTEEFNLIYKSSFFSEDESITVSIPTLTLKDVWNGVHDDSNEKIFKDEVEQFLKMMINIISLGEMINFNSLYIHEISSSCFKLNTNGSIRIKEINTLNLFLKFLQKKCHFELE